jgi:hypothetical protein
MTSIQDKIYELLSTASPQKSFSQQKGGQKYRNIKCLKDILKFLSGDNIKELLNTYLISQEGKYIMDELGLQFKDQYKNIINNIKELHENTNRNNKYKILSLVSNNYTRRELIEMGFKCSSGQFTKSRKPDIIIIPNEKEKYNEEINNTYLPFLKENSREAANRTIYIQREMKDNNMDLCTKSLKRKFDDNEDIQPILSNKKICIPVRYLNNSKINLFKLYKKQNPTVKMSRSNFYKNIPKEYKKAKKFTDLCPICENLKKNEKCLRSLKKTLSNKTFQPVDIKTLKEEIKFGRCHKIFVNMQRACFHAEIFNLKSQHGILLIDFKENLKLGGSPNELNQDFYNRKNCSVLGMCLIYKDINNQIKKEYKDFFSDVLSHDGLFIKDCLHQLLSSINFPKFKHLSIWTDNARHFHSKEIAHCNLIEIPQKYSLQIQWNFFGEYHGKNFLDGHFGLLSRMIKEAEKAQSIINKEECIQCLENQIKSCNENKENMNKKNMKYPNELDINFIIYNREERPDIINQLHFSDFSSYQCMTSEYNEGEYNINGYTTSLLKDGISLKSKIIKKKDTRETRRTIDKNSIKKLKFITQTHNKLQKRKNYINKQKIELDMDMEDVIFGTKEVYIDLMDIDNNQEE